MKKRMLAGLLVLCMVLALGLTACSGDTNAPATTTAGDDAATTTAAAGDDATTTAAAGDDATTTAEGDAETTAPGLKRPPPGKTSPGKRIPLR